MLQWIENNIKQARGKAIAEEWCLTFQGNAHLKYGLLLASVALELVARDVDTVPRQESHVHGITCHADF